eukprot:c2575_g1_i1 orf=1-585(-)
MTVINANDYVAPDDDDGVHHDDVMKHAPCRPWQMLAPQEALHALEEGLLPQPLLNDLARIFDKCGEKNTQSLVPRLHACMCKCGLEADQGNYLVSKLVESGRMTDAQQVFDNLTNRNERSWNLLISGYIKCGKPQLAFSLYEKMQKDDTVHPKEHTFMALLKACAKSKDLEKAFKVHVELDRTGLLSTNVFVGSA